MEWKFYLKSFKKSCKKFKSFHHKMLNLISYKIHIIIFNGICYYIIICIKNIIFIFIYWCEAGVEWKWSEKCYKNNKNDIITIIK